MAVTASPHRTAKDSPSKQILWELQQLAISSQERFYADLDREHEEREALHRQALAEASERHEHVRHTAEQYRIQLEQQLQAEMRRRDEEEQKELARLQLEIAEKEKAARQEKEAERAKTVELKEKEVAERKKLENQDAERRRREKEQKDAEIARRVKEEQKAATKREDERKAAEARAREASAASQKLSATPSTQVSNSPNAQSTPDPRNPELEAEHQRYLGIHHQLKELRKALANQARQNPELKQAMGDMRRQIKKSVGQIREGKGTNKTQLKTIIDTLKEAAAVPKPNIDIQPYLANPPQKEQDSSMPALLVYLLNIFAKAIIAQFVDEAGVKPQIADPIGTVASHIFALPNFRWKDMTLIDILIAKMHVVCPVLFGIYGDEMSTQGKQRLGWWREEKDGPFIPAQRHFERMTGLGAGLAGVSLKNYEKAVAKNPYPEFHYWQALSRIANVPPNEITSTHLVVLKSMIEGFEDRFLQFYGNVAMAALRHVLTEIPRRAPPSVAAKALAGLVDILRREKKLIL